jgi:two-component system, cell cycle sensor histidine kinase and response regulator CckA
VAVEGDAPVGKGRRERLARARDMSAWCGGLVAAIGCLGFVGWAVGSRTLTTLSPHHTSMKANTAAALVLAGTATALTARGRARRLVQLLALAVLAIGAATLVEYVFDVGLGIDRLLFADPWTTGAHPPGRMGANTALCFVLAGGSLLAVDVSWRGMRPAQLGALAIAVIAFVAASGYAFGVPHLASGFVSAQITPMALHTACALLLLSAAIVAARPGVGVLGLLMSPGAGGALLRRLALPVVVLPLTLGWLRLQAQEAHWFDTRQGIVLFATSLIVLFGTLILLTARSLERADEQRTRSEAIVRDQAALLDLTSDAVFVRDFESERLTFWSRGAERLYGFSGADALGRIPHDLLHTRWPEGGLTAVAASLERDGRWEGELGHRTADGRELTVLCRKAVSRDGDGRPRAVLEITTDITTRKQLEEQLRQSQKLEAVGQLAGGVAHDFNNLLTAINGFGRIAGELVGDGPGAGEIDEVLKAGERASQLTRQLLAFSRQQVLELVDLDLGEVAENLEPMLRRLIGEDIEVLVHARWGLPSVRADRSQIEQVLMNLAVNARDAMPGGGTLTIETRPATLDEAYARNDVELEPGRYVCLSVTDTGTGIPPEIADHLFDPFFTTKEVGHGTGLGLATVHGIVTQLGGTVHVYSEPGHGASFKLYLPVSDTPAPPVSDDDRPHQPERLGGTETILLCEDEPPVRRLIERLLTKHGYTVLAAARPAEAIEFARDGDAHIDAVISDVIMPEMTGPDLVAHLHRERPRLPTLFVSGYTGDILRERASLPDDSTIVEKPFEHATLLSGLRELLDAATARAPVSRPGPPPDPT